MRIYFDENFSTYLTNGFKAFQMGARSEGVEVFHITEEFDRGCPDEDWIPKIAQKHGCVVTQDLNIHRRKHQWELCQRYRVGMFFFQQPKKNSFDYWRWIEQVFKFWIHIKDSAKDCEKPFAFAYHPHNKKPILIK